MTEEYLHWPLIEQRIFIFIRKHKQEKKKQCLVLSTENNQYVSVALSEPVVLKLCVNDNQLNNFVTAEVYASIFILITSGVLMKYLHDNIKNSGSNKKPKHYK